MALIEVYHVVADQYPITATTANGSANWIREGMVVTLDANGNTIRHPGDDEHNFMGLAGDSTVPSTATSSQGSASLKNTPYSDPLVINSSGLTAFTQNRVSDPDYNETSASGLMTVYHGGGKFWSSMFVPAATTGAAYFPGQYLWPSNTAGFIGWITNQQPDAGLNPFAVCVGEPQDYPSGVPGTQTSDGSTSLGTYLCLVLLH